MSVKRWLVTLVLLLAWTQPACDGGSGDGGGDNGEGTPPPAGAVKGAGPAGTVLYYPVNESYGGGPEHAFFADTHLPKTGDWWLRPGYVFQIAPDGTQFIWGDMDSNDFAYVTHRSQLTPGGTMEVDWNMKYFGMDRIVYAQDSRAFLGHNMITQNWEFFHPDSGQHFLTGYGHPEVPHAPETPFFSPDSYHYLLWRGNAVTLWEGGAERWALPRGTESDGDLYGNYPAPSFSPSGEWVAVAFYRETEPEYAYDREYLGIQFYHTGARTFTAASLGTSIGGFDLGFGADLDVGPAGGALQEPTWTAGSEALLFHTRKMPAKTGGCETADLGTIDLLWVEDSVEGGKDVTTAIALDHGRFATTDCIGWEVVGTLAGPGALLVAVHRLEPATIGGQQGYLTAEMELRQVALDGTVEATAYYDNRCAGEPNGLCAPLAPGAHDLRCQSWRTGELLLDSDLLVDLAGGNVRRPGYPLDHVSPDCSAYAVDSFPTLATYSFAGKLLNALHWDVYQTDIEGAEKFDDQGNPIVDYGIYGWR
jgi:hypothetical protein